MRTFIIAVATEHRDVGSGCWRCNTVAARNGRLAALPRIVAVVVVAAAAVSGIACTDPTEPVAEVLPPLGAPVQSASLDALIGDEVRDEPVAEAVARLGPVQAGALDALTGDEVRDLCLNAGQYVLAFERAPGPESGIASVEDPLDPSSTALPVDSAFVYLSTDSQYESGWDTFTVEEATCLELTVIYGRARVYELYVGVKW